MMAISVLWSHLGLKLTVCFHSLLSFKNNVKIQFSKTLVETDTWL